MLRLKKDNTYFQLVMSWFDIKRATQCSVQGKSGLRQKNIVTRIGHTIDTHFESM
jgi:hypothetical protein